MIFGRIKPVDAIMRSAEKKALARTLSGVSSNRKNSYSQAAEARKPMSAARCTTLRSVPRGQISSALSVSSQRKNGMFPSNGSGRAVSATIRAGASG